MKWKLPRPRLPTLQVVNELLRLLLLLTGLAMVARGLWLIYPPAMFIICGICLFWAGLPPKGGR